MNPVCTLPSMMATLVAAMSVLISCLFVISVTRKASTAYSRVLTIEACVSVSGYISVNPLEAATLKFCDQQLFCPAIFFFKLVICQMRHGGQHPRHAVRIRGPFYRRIKQKIIVLEITGASASACLLFRVLSAFWSRFPLLWAVTNNTIQKFLSKVNSLLLTSGAVR